MLIHTLSEISDRYEGFIFDIWGVIHNGKTLYPDIIPAMERLRREEKRIVLLSNAPRISQVAVARLQEMGLSPALFDAIYTSGENCREALKRRHISFYQGLGQKFLHIGPERDRTIFEGIDVQEVKNIEDADFLLITGTETFEPTVDRYLPLLESARARSLPVVCANADRYVVFGGEKVICSGLISETYEKMGGSVYYHGKPNKDMYPPVFELLQLSPEKILAIGDSLTTDIQGAINVGLDSLWVLGGVHGEEIKENSLDSICGKVGIFPTYAIECVR